MYNTHVLLLTLQLYCIENVYVTTFGPFPSPNVVTIYSTNREKNIILFKVGDNGRQGQRVLSKDNICMESN